MLVNNVLHSFPFFLLMHKTVNNTVQYYLIDLINVNDKSATVCTHTCFDSRLLRASPISKFCANSFLGRSIMYSAHTMWNTIDLDIILFLLII